MTLIEWVAKQLKEFIEQEYPLPDVPSEQPQSPTLVSSISSLGGYLNPKPLIMSLAHGALKPAKQASARKFIKELMEIASSTVTEEDIQAAIKSKIIETKWAATRKTHKILAQKISEKIKAEISAVEALRKGYAPGTYDRALELCQTILKDITECDRYAEFFANSATPNQPDDLRNQLVALLIRQLVLARISSWRGQIPKEGMQSLAKNITSRLTMLKGPKNPACYISMAVKATLYDVQTIELVSNGLEALTKGLENLLSITDPDDTLSFEKKEKTEMASTEGLSGSSSQTSSDKTTTKGKPTQTIQPEGALTTPGQEEQSVTSGRKSPSKMANS